MRPVAALSRTKATAKLAAAAALALSAVSAAAQVPLTPVAVSGRPTPQVEGRTFSFFQTPAINDTGDVAFNGWLPPTPADPDGAEGVWSGQPGALRLNVLTGKPLPSAGGEVLTGLASSTLINAAGDVYFNGAFSDVPALLVAPRTDPGSPLIVVVRGQEAREARDKQFFEGFDTFPLRLGQGGQAAFVGYLTGKEVEDSNNSAIWTGTAGALSLVTRAGWQAPGTPEGVNFSRTKATSGVSFYQPAIDRSANHVFVANLAGPGVAENSDSGVWFGTRETLKLLAREGDYAPGTVAAYTDFDRTPKIADGHVAFLANLYGPRPSGGEVVIQSDSEAYQAIVAGVPGELRIVVASLTDAPGTGERFAALGTPTINRSGQVAFTALLGNNPEETQDSLWVTESGAPRLLLRSEDAPGTVPGVHFQRIFDPSINDAGQIAFLATLTGSGVNDQNDGGIWAMGTDGTWHLVAREGSVLDLGDGLPRTIADLSFLGGSNGGEDGGASAFNDAGQLTFFATFTNGSSAILLAAVPEPGIMGVAALGLSFLSLRRRRHLCDRSLES